MKSEQNAQGNAEGEFYLGNIHNDKPHLKTWTVVIHENTGLAKKSVSIQHRMEKLEWILANPVFILKMWSDKEWGLCTDCNYVKIHSELHTVRTDAKAETPILWPPHAKSWLIGKDSDAWRDWGQEEKGMTEDQMAGWHHWLNGHEVEWTLGVGDGQGGLACCNSWGCKESDMIEQLNWTELNWKDVKIFCC